MSTQFAPVNVVVDPEHVSEVEGYLNDRGIHTVLTHESDDRVEVRVAPAHAADLADAVEAARASEEEKRQASLRELEASIDVGGLSIAQAERLVELFKAAPSDVKQQVREQIPEDLRQALGFSAPEFEATVKIRFRRSHRPGNNETRAWALDALRHYFDEHDSYCGTGEVTDGREAIRSVRVDEIVSVDES